MLSGKDAHLFEVVSDTTEVFLSDLGSPDFENPGMLDLIIYTMLI